MSYLRRICPEDFGAKGDGVTNDAAAFIAMFAQIAAAVLVGHSQIAELGQKNYLVNPGASIAVQAGTTVVGGGNKSLVTTTANLSLFTVTGDNVYLGRFAVTGNGVGGAQDAIDVGTFPAGPGFENTILEDLTITSMGTAGIFLAGGGDTFQHGPLIQGCTINNCGFAGIWNFFEYSRVNACSLKGNNIGIRIQGGNEIIVGTTITNGTIGVQIIGGGNDGHGVIDGCEINHNTKNIDCFNNLAHGMRISDCEIFGIGTSISLVSSRAVRFIGCDIDVDDYFFDGSQETILQNNNFLGAGTNTIHNNFNGHASHTIWGSGNVGLASTGEQLAFAFPADASQTFTFLQSIARFVVIAAGTITTNTRAITSLLDPSVGQRVLIRNNNAFGVTFLWSSGAGIFVPPNSSMLIGANGVNAILLQENVPNWFYANVTDASTIANATDLALNAATTGQLVLTGTSIALLPGRTYEMICELRATEAVGANTVEFGWVDSATNVELIANTGRGILDLVAGAGAVGYGIARIIYTTGVQQNVKVRGLAGAGVAALAQRFCRVEIRDIS